MESSGGGRLSVAMCTYNGSRYLQDQLDSIASQSRPPDELIVCDDGSTDDTLRILRSFAQMAPFETRICVNHENLGAAKNFEKALGLCSGDLIAFSDQDDVWLPQKLEHLENAMQGRWDAGFVFCDAEVVSQDLGPLGYTLWESIGFDEDRRRALENGEQFRLLAERNFVTGACMMLRADLAPLALPIDGRWIHDYWIAIVFSALDYEAVALEDTLVRYRRHVRQEIGVPKGDLVRRIRRGLSGWGRVAEEESERILVLEERLGELQVSEEKRRLLRQKRRYFEARARIHRLPRPRRLVPAARLLISGEYGRFSRRSEDLAKDLLSKRMR